MVSLICHPDTPARSVSAVEVEWCANDTNEVLLTYSVTGTDKLIVPEPASPGRADELWRATCFEMFWSADDVDEYLEVNLSPSGRWAVYAFDEYRSGMQDHTMAVDPHIEIAHDGDSFRVEADVDLATFPGNAVRIGLSAVIEESDGSKSYWALAHAAGPPDFHNRDCFTATLAAPERP